MMQHSGFRVFSISQSSIPTAQKLTAQKLTWHAAPEAAGEC